MYKSDVADEMEVEIHELMERARAGLKKLKREENDLRTKVRSGPLPQSTMPDYDAKSRLNQTLDRLPGQQAHRLARK